MGNWKCVAANSFFARWRQNTQVQFGYAKDEGTKENNCCAKAHCENGSLALDSLVRHHGKANLYQTLAQELRLTKAWQARHLCLGKTHPPQAQLRLGPLSSCERWQMISGITFRNYPQTSFNLHNQGNNTFKILQTFTLLHFRLTYAIKAVITVIRVSLNNTKYVEQES